PVGPEDLAVGRRRHRPGRRVDDRHHRGRARRLLPDVQVLHARPGHAGERPRPGGGARPGHRPQARVPGGLGLRRRGRRGGRGDAGVGHGLPAPRHGPHRPRRLPGDDPRWPRVTRGRGARRPDHRPRPAVHGAPRPRVPRLDRRRLRPRVAVLRDGAHPPRPTDRPVRPEGGAAGLMAVSSLLPSARRHPGGRPHHKLDLDGTRDLKLLKGPWAKGFAVALAVAYFVIPGSLEETTLRTLCYCGLYAIGAIGLNLLTGFTGQISLGHAAFFGGGAYCAAYFGDKHGWPFPAYVLAA